MSEIVTALLLVSIVLLLLYILYLKKERNLVIKEMRAEKKFMELKEKLRKEILEKSRAGIKGRIGE